MRYSVGMEKAKEPRAFRHHWHDRHWCEKCNKEFPSWSALRKHKEEAHSY